MKFRGEFSPRALWVLFACMMCQTGAGLFYATQSLSRDVIGELGWTRTMWSSAMAPMLLISSVSQAFVGAACVQFGVRAVLTSSVLLLGLTFLVLGNMRELWHFHLAMALLALSNAGFGDVSVGAVVTRWFRRGRSLGLGFALVGSNLGGVIFVHLIALLSESGDWRRAALWVGVGGAALILPFALFVIRDPRPGEGADEESLPTGEPRAEYASVRLSEALRRPAFWVLFFTMFAYALAQLGTVNHLVLYLTDLGYSTREAASALELAMGAGIASKLGAGAIALRLRARTALAFNTALLLGGFLLLPFASDPFVMSVFGVIFGVATAARDVLLPLLVAEVFGVRFFAQLYGCIMVAFFPGGGLGPIAVGAVYDTFGSYQLALAGVAAIVLISLVGQLALRVEARG